MKRIFFLLALVVLFAACSPQPEAERPLRILFFGNSMTNYNDLPQMLTQMADAGGHPIEVENRALNGSGLSMLAMLPNNQMALSSGEWDIVVLQEGTGLAGADDWQELLPAIQAMHETAVSAGSDTYLFMTWGERYRDMALFEQEQAQISDNYHRVADTLDATLVPAGDAWLTAVTQRPDLNLWGSDNFHPNEAGTYLATAVFYAVLFDESPEGNPFTANLTAEEAAFLQAAAAQTIGIKE